MNKAAIIQQIHENYLMAIIRADDEQELLELVDEVVAAGIKSIELTYSHFDVSKALKQINNKYQDSILLGAGTILNKTTCKKALKAGAKYIVAPNFEKEVAKVCQKHKVPYLAGCATASEVARALKNGASIIKAFPAHQLGEKFIPDMQGPFPKLKVMPSGGMNLNEALLWHKAGAFAIGISSDLYKDRTKIKEKAAQYLEIVKEEL